MAPAPANWLSCPWCHGGLSIVLAREPVGDLVVTWTRGLLLCKCCDRTHQRWEEPCTHRRPVVR